MASQQALEGQRGTVFKIDPNDIIIIGLDTDDGVEHVLYDERIRLPVSESLVLNIMHHGVLQPITVRANARKAEVIAGRQRVRAAREANKRLRAQGAMPVKVPCSLRRDKGAKLIGLMVSENEIREDDTPIARAAKAQRMLDLGATVSEIATVFGVGKPTVKEWLNLLDLDDDVQTLVVNKDLAASAAGELTSLPREQQRTVAKDVVAQAKAEGRKATAKDTKRAVGIVTRPGTKEIRDAYEASEEGSERRATLAWVLGLK